MIPASRTERFYTVHDDQTKITVNVLQGESRYAANNLLLGEMTISVPKNKAGAEAVDVTYTYDINSILEVEVLVLSTGEKKKQIIKGKDNDMSDAQIEERMRELVRGVLQKSFFLLFIVHVLSQSLQEQVWVPLP